MEYKFESLTKQKLPLVPNSVEVGTNYLLHNSMLMKRKMIQSNKSGHWSENQNAKYYAFLEKFKIKFCQKESRRQWKVFKALSKFIQTRNANQCRSHHHKMNKNFSSIEETLSFLSKKHPGIKEKALVYYQDLQKIDIGAQQATFPNSFNRVDIQNSQQRIKYQDFFDYQIDQNLRNQQQIKLTDLANIPTGASYNIQQQLNAQLQNYNNLALNTFGMFPSIGLMSNTSLGYQGSSQYYQSPYQEFYENQREEWEVKQQKQRIKQQKWIQCQQLFLNWVNKVNEAINM